MEENTIKGVAEDLNRYKHFPETETMEGVDPIKSVEATEKHDVDHSTENTNETPKNIHPYLGGNIDIKA